MKNYLKTALSSAILLLASLSIFSCSSWELVAENHVGMNPVKLDKDVWRGVWATADGIILIDVVDEKKGELIVGIPDMKEGEFVIDTVHVQVRGRQNDVFFFNILVSNLPERWSADLGPKGDAGYIWFGVRLAQHDTVLLIDMPRKEYFSDLGMLEQIVEPGSFEKGSYLILGDSETITKSVFDNFEEALDLTVPEDMLIWSKVTTPGNHKR